MDQNELYPGKIKISDFDYALPYERIAKYPLDERDASKLLVYRKNTIENSLFKNIDKYLNDNDLLAFNNTKVIPARLLFFRPTGAQIEIFCLEPISPADFALTLQSTSCTWKCIVGNMKKWKEPFLEKILIINGKEVVFRAEKKSEFSSSIEILFTWDNTNITFEKIIETAGTTPIPPYLNRTSEEIDEKRYQTVYSSVKGSVAAPTAGLHFTDTVLNDLRDRNVNLAELTLHVGAGTFKPVQTEEIADHEMHSEFFQIKKDTLKLLYNQKGNVISVGTTTLRTLESLYWIAEKINRKPQTTENIFSVGQWDPYEIQSQLSYSQALEIIIEYLEKKKLDELVGNTQIMIAPGYKIRSIKALVTNFHQPKSTLLLLIATITGDNWKEIYRFALENHYRFLSYGDSSILFL
jgi:S-adenosylmethionine:tRNA ribosyltransferase-isomerase